MQALQVQPQACLVIEDTTTGVRAGVEAGAQVVGLCLPDNPVVTAADLLHAGARHIVSSMHVVLPIISTFHRG